MPECKYEDTHQFRLPTQRVPVCQPGWTCVPLICIERWFCQICASYNLCVWNWVSNSSVGQHLYTSLSVWGETTDTTHTRTHRRRVPHVIRGILISCCGLQPFLSTLTWSIDVMFILLWATSLSLSLSLTTDAKSNNFQLLPVGRTSVNR